MQEMDAQVLEQKLVEALGFTSGGLTIESKGRVLINHSGDYKDWGVGGADSFCSWWWTKR